MIMYVAVLSIVLTLSRNHAGLLRLVVRLLGCSILLVMFREGQCMLSALSWYVFHIKCELVVVGIRYSLFQLQVSMSQYNTVTRQQ
jgi:hypothetical protein